MSEYDSDEIDGEKNDLALLALLALLTLCEEKVPKCQ